MHRDVESGSRRKAQAIGAAYITGECLYVDGGMILHGPISALPNDGYPERTPPGGPPSLR